MCRQDDFLNLHLRCRGYYYSLDQLFGKSGVKTGDKIHIGNNEFIEAASFGSKTNVYKEFSLVLHFTQASNSYDIADVLIQKTNSSGVEYIFAVGKYKSIIGSIELGNIMERIKSGHPISEVLSKPPNSKAGEIVYISNFSSSIRFLLINIKKLLKRI